MDLEHIKVGHNTKIMNRNNKGEGENIIIEGSQCEFEKNSAVSIEILAETHHSVTNTLGNCKKIYN